MAEVTSRIISDRTLKPSAKLIYLYLAAAYRECYMNPMHYGDWSSIAKDTHFSEVTIRRALKHLEALELIKVSSGTNSRETWLSVDLLHMDNDYSVLRQLASTGVV